MPLHWKLELQHTNLGEEGETQHSAHNKGLGRQFPGSFWPVVLPLHELMECWCNDKASSYTLTLGASGSPEPWSWRKGSKSGGRRQEPWPLCGCIVSWSCREDSEMYRTAGLSISQGL